MENHENESAILKMIGQYLELVTVFLRKLHPIGLTTGQIKSLIEEKNHPFWVAFNEATKLLAPPNLDDDTARQVEFWSKFYKEYFGLNLDDLSELQVPNHVLGFDRLIVIARSVSINQVYEMGKKNFSSWEWCDGDIEGQMQVSERGEVKETYAIWVRDGEEADKDLLGEPAENIKNPQDTETLLERLLHGFKYWSETQKTQKHLDHDTYTLCASSRYSDGDVPFVGRDGGDFVNVNRCRPRDRNLFIGARRAVRVG